MRSTGPTGVGKTEIARRLAKLAQAPFVKVEASKFTEVGYVGRDVESMVRDLVEAAIALVRAGLYDRRERSFVPMDRLLGEIGLQAEVSETAPEVQAFLRAEETLKSAA